MRLWLSPEKRDKKQISSTITSTKVRKSHQNIAVPPILAKEVPILAYLQDSLELDAR
jgi:hypothetical protein